MNYNEALAKYFSYKTKYEEGYNKLKHSIISDDTLSRREKRETIGNIKTKCIGCKRQVGTIFQDADRKYSAICGDTENPCGLDISIQKGITANSQMMYAPEVEQLNKIRNSIINTKLNLLFNLIDDSTMVEIFSTLKEEYGDHGEYVSLLEKIFNQDDDERTQLVKENSDKLYQLIKEHNEEIKEYVSTSNPSMLKDATEKYINNILQTQEEIRKNKYQYSDVESDINNENIKHLVQNKYNQQHYELVLEEPEVLSFKLK